MIQIDKDNILKFGLAFKIVKFGPNDDKAVHKPNEDFTKKA